MGKATFLTVISFGFAVFLGTSYYYQTMYIKKGSVNIIPDLNRPGDIIDDAFGNSTIVISDPTLADKFVGTTTASDGHREINEVEESGPPNKFVQSVYDESDKSSLTIKDKWPRAGEPYIVPQMTEKERNLKVKRFQQPMNGVKHGH